MLKTYRYLRIGMIGAVLLLGTAIAIEILFFAPKCDNWDEEPSFETSTAM